MDCLEDCFCKRKPLVNNAARWADDYFLRQSIQDLELRITMQDKHITALTRIVERLQRDLRSSMGEE